MRDLFRIVVLAAACGAAYGQSTPPGEAKGMPPRASAADYQAQAKAGPITIAAEYSGHSIVTPQSTLATEDYLVIEIGVFGPPEARAKLAAADFTLRVNKKKSPLTTVPFGLVLSNVKDPEWEPPKPAKSKTSIGGGGEDQSASKDPPPPVHMPFELQRQLAVRVQKAVLPEGDRPLPQAGLIFFLYRGKAEGVHSLELLYTGPSGAASIKLQP